MDDDEQRPRKKYPVSIAKLSKTPSWIMLGFVLGALFVIALPPLTEDTPAAAPAPAAEPPRAAPPAPQLTTIEAVFEDPRWRDYIVWANDTTEVALWNNQARDFIDFYEARRVGGVNYFRSLTSLTRPIIKPREPLPADCPLRFTAPPAEDVFRDASRRAGREWRPAPQTLPSIELPRPRVQPDKAPVPPKIELTPKAPPEQ